MTNDVTALDVLNRMVWGKEKDTQYLVDHLDPADFTDPQHRALFCFIGSRCATGDPIDVVSLRTALKLSGDPLLFAFFEREFVEGSVDVLDVHQQVPVAGLATAYREQSYAERFRDIVDGVALALSQGHAIGRIKNRLIERLDALDSNALDARSYDDAKQQTQAARDEYRNASISLLRWGYPAFDDNIVPPARGRLYTFAGTAGVGKSTVVRNIYANWAASGEKVAIFSTEMTGKEQRVALASMDSGVPVDKYYRRSMDEIEEKCFFQALEFWETDNLKINERASVSPEWCLKAMKRYLVMGYRIFVIDHLHRIEYNPKGEPRHEISRFVATLKSFALQHNCLVIVLSQLKKISKHQEPSDEYLRETGKIAEESDAVFFVYRPLIWGNLGPTGLFEPLRNPSGGYYFEHEKQRGCILGDDDAHIYIKPDKGRIRPRDVLISIPFKAATGKMYTLAA